MKEMRRSNPLSTRPYKGTRDFYPEEMRFRRWMFSNLRSLVESFGYQEYDGPMLEPFELYAAKTGEEIVNQQLYWMMDRGERKLAVRPEMTPTLARMVADRAEQLPLPIRWYSIPNLWRYERPQRGRLREHWQLNVDVWGGDALEADSEILQVAFSLIKKFKGESVIEIKINHRGLIDHVFEETLKVSGETKLALIKLVDAKNKMEKKAYDSALSDLSLKSDQLKKFNQFLNASFEDIQKEFPCAASRHLGMLFERLEVLGIPKTAFRFDPTVMRGMDYYTGTVFEIFDRSPENNRAMFGGGRYDGLMGLFGKKPMSGIGFGMGDVTLQNFLETHSLIPESAAAIDVFMVVHKEEVSGVVAKLSESLRQAGLKVMTPLGVSAFGKQLKLADRHGCRFAVLLGEDEYAAGNAVVKDLKSGQQVVVSLKTLGPGIVKMKEK